MTGPDDLEKLISQHRLQDMLMEGDVNLPSWLEEGSLDDDSVPTPPVPLFIKPPQPPRPPRIDPPPSKRRQTSRVESPPELGSLTQIRPPAPQPEAVVSAFQLVVRRAGERLGRQVFTHARVRIGRSPDCDLRLDDPGVSRCHALIEAVEVGVYQLRDTNSSNGVLVNGRRVKRWQLRDGDRVTVCEFVLEFSSEVQDTRRAKRHSTSRRARRLLERSKQPTPQPSPSPDPDPDPPAADETVFGRTLNILPSNSRQHADLRERSIPFRAYLRLEGDRQRAAIKVKQYVLQRDVFVIGSGPEADLQLVGLLVPRVCAVIVRGFGGFSVQAIAGWPFQTRVNGGAISGQRILEDGDTLLVGGLELKFASA